MYRRPKFLEALLEIREQMSRDSFYDADLFAENVRNGRFGSKPAKPSANTEEKKSPARKAKRKTK